MPSPIGFQLAPMLYIVFLLLVFFIVTQTFEDDEPDLSINLPSAETPKPGENVSLSLIHIYRTWALKPTVGSNPTLSASFSVRAPSEDEALIFDSIISTIFLVMAIPSPVP